MLDFGEVLQFVAEEKEGYRSLRSSYVRYTQN